MVIFSTVVFDMTFEITSLMSHIQRASILSGLMILTERRVMSNIYPGLQLLLSLSVKNTEKVRDPGYLNCSYILCLGHFFCKSARFKVPKNSTSGDETK